MIEQKQLFRHDPENGIYGDCFRTAIACLLNIKPEQVPHIGPDEWASADAFGAHFDRVLESFGLHKVEIAFDKLDALLATMQICNPRTYYLLSGKSSNGVGHVVIALGGEIVWDPAQDDSGIVGPMDEDGLYWVTFLVPSSMRKPEPSRARTFGGESC